MGKQIINDKTPSEWLQGLKTGTAKFDFCKQQLFRTLKESNTTLDDIGSSQEEIDELEKQNPRKVGVSYAKFWLKKLRTNYKGNSQCLSLLTGLMCEHGITKEEIGATDTDPI